MSRLGHQRYRLKDCSFEVYQVSGFIRMIFNLLFLKNVVNHRVLLSFIVIIFETYYLCFIFPKEHCSFGTFIVCRNLEHRVQLRLLISSSSNNRFVREGLSGNLGLLSNIKSHKLSIKRMYDTQISERSCDTHLYNSTW